MNEKISLFIDDEMGLEEKIFFVKEIRKNLRYLHPKLSNCCVLKSRSVRMSLNGYRGWNRSELKRFEKSLRLFYAAVGMDRRRTCRRHRALMLTAIPSSGPVLKPKNRFVIYKPDVKQCGNHRQLYKLETSSHAPGW